MGRYSFDLHIHSCLSPCGDDASTPATIAGICALNGMKIAALTDHNSCKNTKVFCKACEHYGILGIPGMELNTAEEVHVICLFKTVEAAMEFDKLVYSKLPNIKNKPKLFGNQFIVNENDEVVGEVDKLLITATSIGIYDVQKLVSKYDGVCFPAHIDKDSNSLIHNLGFYDPAMNFKFAELSFRADEKVFKNRKDISGLKLIKGSDAHYINQLPKPFQTLALNRLSRSDLIEYLKQ